MKTHKKKSSLYLRSAVLIIICAITGPYLLDQYCKKIFSSKDYNGYKEFFTLFLKESIFNGLIIAPITNTLFTKSENLASTKLPVWEIQLSGKKLAELNSDLPSSGRIYHSGTVTINSATFPARFRFRGDSFWHWKSKQKSWKIRLKGDHRYQGKREFNLVNPKFSTTLVWPMAAFIAQSMGLKTPRLQHVHARLNGQYLGVLYLIENFDHDFTVQSGLPEGALYEDEALGVDKHNSYKEIAAWKIRPPGIKKKHQAGKNPEDKFEKRLNDLLRCLDIKDDEVFTRELEEILDIHHYLTWWACTIICLDIHQDHQHNNRLYLDPTSAKFRQIPWDMFFGGGPLLKFGLNLNPITERLSQLPEYVYARNKIIWDALNGPVSPAKQINWLDKTAATIRDDIYCDPYKDSRVITLAPLRSIMLKKISLSMHIQPVTNRTFENDLIKLKDFLIKRASFNKNHLSESDLKLFLYSTPSYNNAEDSKYAHTAQLSIQVGGRAGIQLKDIKIFLKSASDMTSTPLLLYGNNRPFIKIEEESIQSHSDYNPAVYTFRLNELLLPGRTDKPPFGPASVQYPFSVSVMKSTVPLPEIRKVEVRGVHPFTKKEILLYADLTDTWDHRNTVPDGKFLPHKTVSKKIIWQGIKNIDRDFRVQKDEMLIIRPGTRIEFTQGSSLLSYGRVTAIGSQGSPIVFTRAPGCSSWGAIALQGPKASGSVFQYCTFEYGSDVEREGVFYSGALSIYNADASIKKCLFRFNQGDDALNTKFSTTDVLQSTFSDNKADAYDLDFSGGLIAENIFKQNGNDGIDCGTADPTIKDNIILNCMDKGISIGEQSNPVVVNNHIAYCEVGLAVKDLSSPTIKGNEFLSNKIAVKAYQKKKVFGGVNVTIHDSKFKNNDRLSESDDKSVISFRNCLFDNDISEKNMIYFH